MRAYALLTLEIAAVALAQAPVPCPPVSLNEAQVLQLVRDRVPEGRIAQFVSACHIAFFPTSEILVRLANAGATSTVLEALRQDDRSEEHNSELQSLKQLVCRL